MANHSSVSPSPFLRLPAELRNIIYGYVFGDPSLAGRLSYTFDAEEQDKVNGHPLLPPSRSYWEENGVSADKPPISLIYTDRQIHAETRLLLYMHGMFRFEGVASLEKFMKKRSQSQKAAVQHLEIIMMPHPSGDYYSVFDKRNWIRCLSGMSGVKTILLNERGHATDTMVKHCVMDVYKVVSTSSPAVEIEAEGLDPYCKGQWVDQSKNTAAVIQLMLQMMIIKQPAAGE